jgi:hypothetical protein
MGTVYSQAAGTIAASWSMDSAGGLFCDRDPEVIKPRIVDIRWTASPPFSIDLCQSNLRAGHYWCDIENLRWHAVDDAPLNKRAWVCQERLLSPRVMHFTSTQIFWECNESTACENYPFGLPTWAVPRLREDPRKLKNYFRKPDLYAAKAHQAIDSHTKMSVDVPNKDDVYNSWHRFLEQYSNCGLTKDQDKLVALKGIADVMSHTIEDRLVAGLWRSHLPQELCWYKLLPDDPATSEPSSWRAPTWSWASSNAMITTGKGTYHQRHNQSVTWIDIVDLDVNEAPSGELISASMCVRCKVVPAIIHFRGRDERPRWYGRDIAYLVLESGQEILCSKHPEDNPGDLEAYVDDLEQPDSRHVHLMIIQYCQHELHQRDNREEPVGSTLNDDQDSLKHCGLKDANTRRQKSVDRAYSAERDTAGATKDEEVWYGMYLRESFIEGLMLVAQNKESNTFTRVGMFTISGADNVGKMVAKHAVADEMVITLV